MFAKLERHVYLLLKKKRPDHVSCRHWDLCRMVIFWISSVCILLFWNSSVCIKNAFVAFNVLEWKWDIDSSQGWFTPWLLWQPYSETNVKLNVCNTQRMPVINVNCRWWIRLTTVLHSHWTMRWDDSCFFFGFPLDKTHFFLWFPLDKTHFYLWFPLDGYSRCTVMW